MHYFPGIVINRTFTLAINRLFRNLGLFGFNLQIKLLFFSVKIVDLEKLRKHFRNFSNFINASYLVQHIKSITICNYLIYNIFSLLAYFMQNR